MPLCLLRFIVWSFLKARLQFTLDQFNGATSVAMALLEHGELSGSEIDALAWLRRRVGPERNGGFLILMGMIDAIKAGRVDPQNQRMWSGLAAGGRQGARQPML